MSRVILPQKFRIPPASLAAQDLAKAKHRAVKTVVSFS